MVVDPVINMIKWSGHKSNGLIRVNKKNYINKKTINVCLKNIIFMNTKYMCELENVFFIY